MTDKPTLNGDLDSQKVAQAQHTLVNTAISVALDMAFEAAQEQGKPMANTWGETKKETFDNLTTMIIDDRKRVRAYNQLVKPIGVTSHFDLSLKSSGAKTEESIKAKMIRRQTEDMAQISDVVRLSAVSGDITILDSFANRVKAALEKVHHESCGKQTSELESWEVRANGLMHKVLKSEVDHVAAELQFLPRQQAHMATRITHKYFEAIRLLDEENPSVQSKKKFIDGYNKLATWMNDVFKKAPLTDYDVVRANHLLLTNDANAVTFDSVTEGGESPANDRPSDSQQVFGYERIFKDVRDLRDYVTAVQHCVHEGCAPLTMPMKKLNPSLAESNDKDVFSSASNNLLRLTQITHAYYMREAPEPMRNQFVKLAQKINHKSRKQPMIPEIIIAQVPHGLGLDHGPDGGSEKGGVYVR